MPLKSKLNDILIELSKELPKFPDGRIDYTHAHKAPGMTCFIKFKDKILLLERSNQVSTYKGMWGSVAGYIDEFPLRERSMKNLKKKSG